MILESVRRAARLTPNAIATIDSGRERTHAEFCDRIARLAAGLTRIGVKPRSKVGLLAQNADHFLESLYAIWWAGAVAVPMNTRWALPEHLYSIDDAGISFLLFDGAFAEMAYRCAEARPSLQGMVALTPGSGAAHDADALIRSTPPAPPFQQSLNDIAGVFYTGGTTGFPKGVVHTAASLFAAALTIALDAQYPHGARYIHALPMFHLGDLGHTFAVTVLGGSHVFMPRFDPTAYSDLIRKHQVQICSLVPSMIGTLVDSADVRPDHLQSVRILIYGGAPIGEERQASARRLFAGARLVQVFGQTETCGAGVMLPDDQSGRRGAVGRSSVGCEISVIRSDGGQAAEGEVGEICIRGAFVMSGYLNKDVETASALRNGRVHTGDAGYLDADGYLYICDRVKDMIISGGENVYSAEVERAIATHPKVAEVAVIGVPDAHWGERVHAIIVPKPGTEPTYEEIYQHCKRLIAGYKTPRSLEIRRSPLPLSAVGKILKNELRKPYWRDKERQVN